MRRQELFGVLLILTATLSTAAQPLSQEEQSFLDKHLSDYVTTQATRISSEALSKVFSVSFYKIRVTVKLDQAASEAVTVVVARDGDRLVSMQEPGTDTHLNTLLAMIAPSFKLKTDADAKILQEAMDALFPLPAGVEKKYVGFTHIESTWYFSRRHSSCRVGGKDIDCHRGFQVGTDIAGAITSVDYALLLDGPLALDPKRR